jgi:hypothetical protein
MDLTFLDNWKVPDFNLPTGQDDFERMANLANMRYSNVRQPPKQTLEELMDQSSDPFYHAGLTKLENVKEFEDDPYFQIGTAPNPEKINQHLLKSDTEGFMGYTLPETWNTYVASKENPTAETASTVTHEGIHNLFDPTLTGIGEGVIQGTISDSGSALGDDYMTEEIMTNYLSNLIHGENEPFYPGDYIPKTDSMVNYATMMRPGQGAIGMKGIMDLLAKRGKPFLRKGALRAHRNIEGRYQPPVSPGGGGGGWSPSGADLSPGGGYGQSPTGSDVAGTPFSRGGILGAF